MIAFELPYDRGEQMSHLEDQNCCRTLAVEVYTPGTVRQGAG